MKSNFFIVYKRSMIEEITWPDSWGHQCCGNLAPMLREALNLKNICSEIKMIWNQAHKIEIIKNNNVTPGEIDDYISADSSSIHFQTEHAMTRAVKELIKRGANPESFVALNDYRNVILQQAYFKHNKTFILENVNA